jgi:hypothetical protein
MKRPEERENLDVNILVCIDDTDNMESRGTGALASLLSDALEDNGWGDCQPVTRHQMLVHPDIPYTSHNSSMCFAAEIERKCLGAFTGFAKAFLEKESAPGSDPGLCIVNRDRLRDPGDLMAFGRRAKTTILTKKDAYRLAGRLEVHLSEHGGTGLGIIGALAGCGLRLTGNDGRFRGHFQVGTVGDRVSVADLIDRTGVDVVKSLDGELLQQDEMVEIGEKVKAVLLEGKSTLLVFAESRPPTGVTLWQTCTKQQLRSF